MLSRFITLSSILAPSVREIHTFKYFFHRCGRLSRRDTQYKGLPAKIAAARITDLDIGMFHHEFPKPIYFGVKRLRP